MNPSPTLPTERELALLPYFAILALGARGAQRGGPVGRNWEGAPEEHSRAIVHAPRDIAKLAASPSMVARAPLWGPARQSTRVAIDAAAAADIADAPHEVLCAADAAAELGGAIDLDTEREPAARAVSRTVRASVGALVDADGSQQREFLEWLSRLLTSLKESAASEGWTNATAVKLREM
ncbi:MAG: hypothetical protein AAGB93_07520 [Planctomycetota bacterium]